MSDPYIGLWTPIALKVLWMSEKVASDVTRPLHGSYTTIN